MYKICEGVRVLEVAGWVMVPAAGLILSDWGADVIKVEDPAFGDPYRGLKNAAEGAGGTNPMLEIANRGKRSVGIDLRTPGGKELLYRLASTADVFLTSYMTDARRKLKIELQDIRAHNPNIIYARGSGYGLRGPKADKPGFDGSATWARGGVGFRMTSPAAKFPTTQPGSFGDLGGGLTLAAGIAGALYSRERTGTPQEVDVSLYHVGMYLMSQSITAAAVGVSHVVGSGVWQGSSPARDETSANMNINPMFRAYQTQDDRWLQMSVIQPDPYWPDFCRHLEVPELISDPRFVDFEARATNYGECCELLAKVFRTRSLADWEEKLATFTGVWDPYFSPEEITVDAQALENGYFPEVRGEDGRAFRAVASPVQFGGEMLGDDLRPMPEVGQHTEEVLLELGLSWDEILGIEGIVRHHVTVVGNRGAMTRFPLQIQQPNNQWRSSVRHRKPLSPALRSPSDSIQSIQNVLAVSHRRVSHPTADGPSDR